MGAQHFLPESRIHFGNAFLLHGGGGGGGVFGGEHYSFEVIGYRKPRGGGGGGGGDFFFTLQSCQPLREKKNCICYESRKGIRKYESASKKYEFTREKKN